MKIEEIALNDVKPYEKNPKAHSKKQIGQIAESIKRYGMVQPLVVDKKNALVIGHGRYEAMQLLNMETAPCVRAGNLTPKQIRELRIIDNKLNEGSGWNEFLLDEMKDLDLSEFDLKMESWFNTDRSGQGKQEGNDEYNAFVSKFEAKHTTDDCYTPDAVYDVICEYIEKEFKVKRKHFARPFYPGGDFENFDYSENCVVVDNPPFSILSKIIKFYIERKIRFFLFVPHLTAGHYLKACQLLLTGAQVTYENGAIVCTSFATNLFNSVAVRLDGELKNKLEEACQNTDKKDLPSYEYPPNLWKAAIIGKYIDKFMRFDITNNEIVYTHSCGGINLFGGGFFVSDKVAKAAEAKAKAAEAKAKAKIKIELTPDEKRIIEKLNANEFLH